MSFNLSFFTNSMTSSPNLAVLSSKSYTLSLGFWISFDIWPLSFEIYIMFYVTSDIRSASLSSSIKSKTSSLACSLATSYNSITPSRISATFFSPSNCCQIYSATSSTAKIRCILASFPLIGTRIVSPAISRETISFLILKAFPQISLSKAKAEPVLFG